MSKFNNDRAYADIMAHLKKLQPYKLTTTGRTGTDFLQSLLDSHTEVLTFNGSFWFHDFWNNSKCTKTDNIIISDLLDEFVGINLDKLKSKYDVRERKDSLGDNGDQSIDIDLAFFKTGAIKLLHGRKVTSRNFFLAVLGSGNT